jgi:predicted dehydrogenase
MPRKPSLTQKSRSWNRRDFLKVTGAGLVLPTILPGCASEKPRHTRASNRIVVGIIGYGMQGTGNTKNFLFNDECQVVAVCDLDKGHLNTGIADINDHYENKDCKGYSDYRELLARDDIDAVMIAVPDQWHELVASEAARRGKDIYGEKPLARTIAEQQAIVKAVQKHKIIWQTGSWQRSQIHFHKAAEIVRNGLIGTVTHVEVGLPSGYTDFAKTVPALLTKLGRTDGSQEYLTKVVPGTPDWDTAVTSVPTELDFETWIGPSKMEPYIEARVHRNWRWNYNTGGGQLLDWVGHHCDIAHWGLGFDNSGPSEIEGHGEFPDPKALWNTSPKYRIELKYPNGISMTIADKDSGIVRGGVKWIGTDGWVWVDRDSKFEGSNPEWKTYKSLPEGLRKIKLYESRDHTGNFIDCVKSRKPTITPVETAHHSAIPGHLGLISMLTGRKIRWNVQHEKIIDDPGASKMMVRDYRSPWKIT